MADINETPENPNENEVEAHGESVRPLQELGTDGDGILPPAHEMISTVSLEQC